jgi:hypothetical protein
MNSLPKIKENTIINTDDNKRKQSEINISPDTKKPK